MANIYFPTFLQQYQRAVIFRFGKIRKGGARGPGIFFVNPFIDDVEKVDMRTLSFNVPAQEILSRDSVTVKVDAVVYYSVQVRKRENRVKRFFLYSSSASAVTCSFCGCHSCTKCWCRSSKLLLVYCTVQNFEDFFLKKSMEFALICRILFCP